MGIKSVITETASCDHPACQNTEETTRTAGESRAAGSFQVSHVNWGVDGRPFVGVFCPLHAAEWENALLAFGYKKL